MPSRRRTTATFRRPRVAGLNPARADEAADGATIVTEVRPARRVRPRPAPAVDAAEVDAAEVDAAEVDAAEAVETGPSVEVAPDDETVEVASPVVEEPAVGAESVDTTKPEPVGRRRLRAEALLAEPGSGPAESPGPGWFARLRTVPVLAGALVVLLALAVFFGVSTLALRTSPATANTALTDIGTTTEVATQLGDALEIVYSYDFARLDENERAAREVITTAFSTEFDRLFTQVRDLAPQQQAVVSATVTVSAVQEISGDRAVLVAFMDQQATTVANAEQVEAGGRLTVVGERVDGRWKIASVESR